MPEINYDQIASNYSIYRNASRTVISHIMEQLADRTPKRILEIGCGTADHLYALNHLLKAEGHGFDRSAEMLRESGVKNPGLILKPGNAEELFPYENAYFHFAFSIDVIHYIGRLENYFQESYRVLALPGTLLTVTDSEEDIRGRTLSRYFPESVDIELQRYPSPGRIVHAMEEAGFQNIEITHTRKVYTMTARSFEKIKNKAFSILRLISDECFQKGIEKLAADMKHSACEGNLLYTYIWGKKV